MNSLRDRISILMKEITKEEGTYSLWDGNPHLNPDDPQSILDVNSTGVPSFEYHDSEDRGQFSMDMSAPLDDGGSPSRGRTFSPRETNNITKSPVKYNDRYGRTTSDRDSSSMEFNFLTTPQEITKNAMSLNSSYKESWWIITDYKPEMSVGHSVHHTVAPDVKEADFPLIKFFREETRPLAVPDIFSHGFVLLYRGTDLRMLGENIFKPERLEDKTGMEITVDISDGADDLTQNALAPKTLTTHISADNEGTDEDKKDKFYVVQVEPESTPFRVPTGSMEIGDWWEQTKRMSPSAISTFMAPSAVRVMGESKRLYDIYSEFKNPSVNDTAVKQAGIGLRFPSGNSQAKDTRRPDELNLPQSTGMLGYDNTKINPTDGTRTSTGNRNTHNSQIFDTPRVSFQGGLALTANKTAQQRLESVADKITQSLGVERSWGVAHSLYKIANNVADRAMYQKAVDGLKGSK